jgi:general secretion pathway protein D
MIENFGVSRLAVCLALVLGALCTYAQPSQTQGEGSDAKVSLTLASMEVNDAMKMLSDATGYSIIVSPNAKGPVTAYVTDMPPEQALKQIVEVNGFHYVKNGNVVWVLSDKEYFEDFNLGRERKLISLSHARAVDVAASIAAAVSKNAIIIPYPETNVIIVADAASHLTEIEEMIKGLDVAPAMRTFQLQHASAEEVLALLQYQVPLPTGTQADRRTNQLIITAPDAILEHIARLIADLDKPDMINTRVFPLKYADATETAAVVREILTGKRDSSSMGMSSGLGGGNEVQEVPRVFTTQPGRPNAATPITNWNQMRTRGGAGLTATGRTGTATGASAAPSPPTPSASGTAPAAIAPKPTPESGAVAGTPEGEAVALGPISSVVADARTNSVIVTHVASVLERIAEIIETLDVAGTFHTYQFQNVDPAELEIDQRLAPLFPAAGSFVTVDPVSKKVTFRAPNDQADDILKLLKEWDDHVPQVRIEAEIMSVNATFFRELGISWQALLKEVTDVGIVNSADVRVDFPSNIGTNAPQTRISIGDITDDDYNAILQALRNNNDTQSIASPRILVRDGKEALFSSVRDEPYTVVTLDGTTQTKLEDVKFLNVGVTLAVAPTINQDNLIALDVQLELSDLVEFRNNIPVVDRATAQSNVSVHNGGTIILAGLLQRARTEFMQGVPGLSKVPLLGNLFRNKRNQKSEREIVLVLRPFIIGNNEQPQPAMNDIYMKNGLKLKERRLD